MNWLFQAAKKGRIKSLAQAIREFFNINNRMPSLRERNTMGSILQDITQKSNVIDIRSRFKDPWWKTRPKQGIKKADEDPTSAMYDRHIKEIEGIDQGQGMGFYREMGDIMKKHRREELELEYDTMYNKILDKAKRIESDPLPLLEAELGKKLTGKETTTQLLDLFKNRPKKASGGIARVGMFMGGGLIKLAKLKKLFPRIHIDSLLEASRIKDPKKLQKMLNSFRKTEQYLDDAPRVELFDFDVKGRRPNASGGIAGELHLNRPGYKSGLLAKLFKLKKKPTPKKTYLEELAEKRKKIMGDEAQKEKDFEKRLQEILAKHSTKHAEGGLAKILGV